MNKYNFKDAMNLLKQEKQKIKQSKMSTLKDKDHNIDSVDTTFISNQICEKKYIRYSEVIKEKIKENKKEDRVLRNFEEIEQVRDEWYKMRNIQLNKEKDELFITNSEKNNKIIDNKNSSEFTNSNPLETELSQTTTNNFELMLSTKQYKISINSKEIIEEHTEQNDTKRIINSEKFSTDLKCFELYNWFHLMFQAWEKQLDSLPEETKLNNEGREKLGIYKQCRGYIKPLLKLLKRKEITKEIMNKLFEVMVFCLDRDYIRAHDSYIELAIGNAPWPMGVTMVGIHERSGRSKIYKSQVAHILNDENTKKYLQSVKRVMSLVQRLYPTSPSNQVVS
jgi:pre-mRNA-splicing factor 18